MLISTKSYHLKSLIDLVRLPVSEVLNALARVGVAAPDTGGD